MVVSEELICNHTLYPVYAENILCVCFEFKPTTAAAHKPITLESDGTAEHDTNKNAVKWEK